MTLDALKQSNISLLLSGVSDNVAGSIPVTVRQGSQSFGITDWRTDLKDGVNVLGAVAGLDPDLPGAGAVAALVEFGIDASAQHTVDPKGRTLTELTHVPYTAGQLADAKAQQLVTILTTMGNDFTRIYDDWGRLKLVGATLTSNQLQWTPDVDADVLASFNVATAREFYRTIIPSAFQVNQYRYASPGLHNANGLAPNSENCRYYDFMSYQNENPKSPTSQQTSYSYALLPERRSMAKIIHYFNNSVGRPVPAMVSATQMSTTTTSVGMFGLLPGNTTEMGRVALIPTTCHNVSFLPLRVFSIQLIQPILPALDCISRGFFNAPVFRPTR